MSANRYYHVNVNPSTWHAMLAKFLNFDHTAIVNNRDMMIPCGSYHLDNVVLRNGNKSYNLGSTNECTDFSNGDGLIGMGDLFLYAIKGSDALKKFGLEESDFKAEKAKGRYGNAVYDRGIYVSERALEKILQYHGVTLNNNCLGNSHDRKVCYASDVLASNKAFRIFAGAAGFFDSDRVFDAFEKMFLSDQN